MAKEIEQFLNIAPLTWADADQPLADGHSIRVYEHLITRIDPKDIAAMTEANKDNLQATQEPALGSNKEAPSEASYISIDDFSKVDLRIAKIVNGAWEGLTAFKLTLISAGKAGQVFA